MKPRIYLIPGTMCTAQLWCRIAPHLESAVELIHLPPYQHASLSAYFNQLNQCLPDTPVHLVGFSLGGYLATRFATQYPSRVRQLFVISNTPCALGQTELTARQQALALVERYGYKGISRKRAADLLDRKPQARQSDGPSEIGTDENRVNETGPDQAVIDIIIEMDRVLGEQTFKLQLQTASARQDLMADLLAAELSTSFYYSEGDPLLNTDWLQRLETQTRDGRCHLLPTPGRGHMLPLEKPHELAKHLLDWLSLKA
ncbi:alpha/beta fold hydrolase [Photobacterium sp. TY1-4]|uniref:alpha/beta fold hydrolase n=1 Tax=Photobacterium sp. TY1-4 TaxID=2899122 RepID=UPI0021C15ABC|nr:alpha/beta hydrolase [Photobacterium sp. TY1-4]UXI02567.1 alpha/beta hydrolase [Photobacterium sp. TY1-4]